MQILSTPHIYPNREKDAAVWHPAHICSEAGTKILLLTWSLPSRFSLFHHREAWPSTTLLNPSSSYSAWICWSTPAVSPQCYLKIQYVSSCLLACYPTYLGELHTNTPEDILPSFKLLLWWPHNTARGLNWNLSFHPSFFSPFFFLCSQVWIAWILKLPEIRK